MNTSEFLLGYWNLNIFALFLALILLIFHLITNRFRLTKKSIIFFAGLSILILIYSSPLDYLANNYLFSAHMIEHIIVLLVIPPLLLTGTNKHFLEKLLENESVQKVSKYLFNPLFAWFLGVGAMWVWHVPYFFGLMQRYPIIHFVEMSSLILLGIVFIWPVFCPIKFNKLEPVQAALYLFLACVGCTVLGIFITFAPVGLYTSYYSGGNLICGFNLLSKSNLANSLFSISNPQFFNLIQDNWGITKGIDQQMAGLIMWIPACFVYITNIMVVLTKWFGAEQVSGNDKFVFNKG